MNDTHPTVAVAELMRILLDDEGLTWDEAWAITTKTCAYTNHTIMAEALEKWPIELFSRLLPRIYQIIEEINRRFLLEIEEEYPGNQYKRSDKMAIIYDGQVKMAHLAIVAGYSVNGVARLAYRNPEKTGIKRFLRDDARRNLTTRQTVLHRDVSCYHGNPLLADWVYRQDRRRLDYRPKSSMKKLAVYVDDRESTAGIHEH